MSMVLVASTVIMKSNICAFVKLSLFHLVKFWDKDVYGEKSYKTNTVCGWFAKVHNIKKSKDFSWWDHGVSKEMGRMHTDHRNNCIKAIKTIYKGKKMRCHPLFFCFVCFRDSPFLLLKR